MRVALIGYGYAGRTFHAPLVRATPGLELMAVSSSRPDRVTADLPGVEVVQSRELFTTSSVDLIVIATSRESPGVRAGLWHDLGPHLVDQALQLFGLPDRVMGCLAAQRPGSEVDDWAHVVLEYGRLRVILHASVVVAAPSPRFIVHGNRGSW